MAATFSWAQNNGAPAGTVTILGASGNLADFKEIDDATVSDYAAFPIVAGNRSFEIWLRAWFTQPFNQIRGLRFWQSTNFSPSNGLQVFWTGTQVAYLQPFNGTSSVATSSIPIMDPGTANVSLGGSLTSCLIANGYSDFIVMQLMTTSQAQPGDTSLMSGTLSYSES